jgi:hypothetical protein
MNPTKNREQLVEKMFETYGFGASSISIQAMLTLYAQGLMTGTHPFHNIILPHVIFSLRSPITLTFFLFFTSYYEELRLYTLQLFSMTLMMK